MAKCTKLQDNLQHALATKSQSSPNSESFSTPSCFIDSNLLTLCSTDDYGRTQSSSVSPRGGGYGSSASTPHSSNGGYTTTNGNTPSTMNGTDLYIHFP